MYVVTNTLRVPAEHAANVEHGFSHSVDRMKQIPGCLNFTLLKEEGVEGNPVYVAMTHWQDEAAFRAWVASEDFRRAHANAGQSGAMGEVHSYSVVF
jgi:heme oxygenase (staphylobilin-producing)